MNSRRNFILQSLAMGAMAGHTSLSYASQLVSNPTKELREGLLCVPVYGANRLPIAKDNPSVLVKINPLTEEVSYLPSTVRNLHGLVEAKKNPEGFKLGIGHESREYVDLYDKNFNRIEVLNFKGLAFRGHGHTHGDNVIVTSESIEKAHENGILLLLDAKGKEIQRFSTGGSRPHEIVECGDYYAIAHYGNRPYYRPTPSDENSVLVDNCHLQNLVEMIQPGVSFIRKSDLQVHAFYPLPTNGQITHLAVTEQGDVLAMGMNAFGATSAQELEQCALTNKVNLLNIEMKGMYYEIYIPIYRLSAEKGLIETINAPVNDMRRGQSFSFDPSVHLIVGTFAASQTIFVRSQGKPDKFLSTLKYGVADPRGCALIPGTGLVAVSGNTDNISIIDVESEKLVKIIGVPLGQHSHLYWWNT